MTDLLDTDLNQLKTTLPLLQPGIYKLNLVESRVEPNAAGDGDIWRLRLETAEPAQSMDGETVPAGFPIFHVVNLTVKGNATQTIIARNVAQVIQSLERPVKATVRDIFENWGRVAADILPNTVKARIGLQPERIDKTTGRRFDANNVVERFIPNRP